MKPIKLFLAEPLIFFFARLVPFVILFFLLIRIFNDPKMVTDQTIDHFCELGHQSFLKFTLFSSVNLHMEQSFQKVWLKEKHTNYEAKCKENKEVLSKFQSILEYHESTIA